MRDLEQYRGSPVVLVFRPSSWNPAQHEFTEAYNRLIQSLPGADGVWHSLSFDDAAVSLAVLDELAPSGAEFGLDSEKGTDADYYRISPRLPRETQDYVPMMIAAGRISKNPAKYGFADNRILAGD